MKLPPDWSELIGFLGSHRVRYLIVGAHALAANGKPRAGCPKDLADIALLTEGED